LAVTLLLIDVTLLCVWSCEATTIGQSIQG
jgi:hypothetical protein